MIPEQISHYQLIKELGSGGMGVVYLARDTKLGRNVALKVLSAELAADPNRLHRFIREARAASLLEHPNIAQVYEIGQADAIHFIAMQYVEGQTLHDYIRGRPLKKHETINFAVQIADALEEAHSKGIIHRDMKSSNLMVTSRSQVKVLDFGLAKMSEETELGSKVSTIEKTEEGTVLGTVPYMSPEQALGKALDHRSDIFSMGVVLYEMATGKLPFAGKTTREILARLLQSQPEPVVRFNYDLPQEFDRIVCKSLEKDREYRYQSARDLKIDLMNLQRNLQKGIVKTGLNTDKARFHKSRGYLWSAIVLAILVVAVVFFKSLYSTSQNKSRIASQHEQPMKADEDLNWKTSIAVLPFKNLSSDPEQEYFCDGMTEQMITNLTHIPVLKVIAQTSVMQYKQNRKSAQQIGQELGVKFMLEGSIQRAADRVRITAQLIDTATGVHVWANNYDRALDDIFAIQDEVSQAIAGNLEVSFTQESLSNIKESQPNRTQAYEYYLKARYIVQSVYATSRRDEDFKRGLRFGLRSVEIDPGYAIGYAGLVYLYEIHYGLTRDANDLRQMKKYGEKAYELNPHLAETNAAKAWYLQRSGQQEKAYPYLKKALQLNPNHAGANHTAAVFNASLGLYYQAVKLYSRAIALNPVSVYSRLNRGCVHAVLGEPDKTISDFQKVASLEPELMQQNWCLAQVHLMNGQYRNADLILDRSERSGERDSRLRETRALYYALLGQKDKALALSRTAWVLAVLGMTEEALSQIEKEILDTSYHNFHWHTYLMLNSMPWYRSLRNDSRFRSILNSRKKEYEKFLETFPLP